MPAGFRFKLVLSGPTGPVGQAEKKGAGIWSYGGDLVQPNVETLVTWNTSWWAYPETGNSSSDYYYYANNDRFTVPTDCAGLHAVNALLCFYGGAGPKGGWKSVRIYVNNALVHKQDYADTNQTYQYCEANTLLDLAAGDYVTVKAYHTGSAAVNIGDFVRGGCHFQIVKQSGPKGDIGSLNPYRIGQTWGIGGVLTASMILPNIFVPVRANQSVKIVGARATLTTGTSIGIVLTRNGSAVGSTMTVTTFASSVTLNQALADGDRLQLTTSAPVGSPSDLSYTVYLEHSAV